MRVRRECENCGSLFHAGKACPQCGSTKYKRRPPKRTEAEREESRKKRAALLKAQAENAPIVPDWNPSAADRKAVLRRPAKTGGQDLVYKKPRQRVRRTCCQCQRLFVAHNKTCPGCQHVRCTDCPREPAKKDKYPFGYPGDEWGARSIPHFECPQCQTIFQAKGGEGTDCPQCRHENCPRVKPRKFEPEPDPEVWKSVQAKLEELKLD
ncbi:hypothetical protein VTK73DRAFT_5408 [Phialemonium thermophilum]|uniref:Uncharacterized protein n=1 Tax=Phialemonium thermophilum TaxID=223376 RepID=A0ABR3V209_9PEZI